MSPILTRRDFLGDAAMAGVASALDLHAAPRKKLHESAPPPKDERTSMTNGSSY